MAIVTSSILSSDTSTVARGRGGRRRRRTLGDGTRVFCGYSPGMPVGTGSPSTSTVAARQKQSRSFTGSASWSGSG